MNSTSPILADVDLRAAFGAAREQGARNSCLACATSDAHAHAHQLAHPLSAEYLFHHAGLLMPGATGAKGLSFQAVDQALKTEGQPHESECPYQLADIGSWVAPAITRLWHGELAGGTGTQGEIAAALKSGQPVLLAIELTSAFLTPNAAPFILEAASAAFGAHAVLAVGLAPHPSLHELTLIRNSWGLSWGNAGHAWLSQSYLAHHLIGFRAVATH